MSVDADFQSEEGEEQ